MSTKKNLTAKTLRVLAALRKNIESTETTDANGIVWGTVYLDNASQDLKNDGIEGKQFSAHLSALTIAGLYREENDPQYKKLFGYVVREEEVITATEVVAPDVTPATVMMVTEDGLKEVPIARAPKSIAKIRKDSKKAIREQKVSARAANKTAGEVAPEVEAAPTPKSKTSSSAKKEKAVAAPASSDDRATLRAARAILKASTLKEIPGTIRMSLLVDTTEPSDEAIAKLIAEAKEIGLDLAHSNWAKTARAIAAGDFKLAK